jgi:hypothetical protein
MTQTKNKYPVKVTALSPMKEKRIHISLEQIILSKADGLTLADLKDGQIVMRFPPHQLVRASDEVVARSDKCGSYYPKLGSGSILRF